MGRHVKANADLLERLFSRPEWEFLKRNKEFQAELLENVTLDDVENISVLGDRLLGNWERDNPTKARFKRSTSSRKISK